MFYYSLKKLFLTSTFSIVFIPHFQSCFKWPTITIFRFLTNSKVWRDRAISVQLIANKCLKKLMYGNNPVLSKMERDFNLQYAWLTCF